MDGSGIGCFKDSIVQLIKTRIVGNAGSAIRLHDNSKIESFDCDIRGNADGGIQDKRMVAVPTMRTQ